MDSSSRNNDIFSGFYHTYYFLVIHNDPLDRNCCDIDEDDIVLKHFQVTLKHGFPHIPIMNK